MRVTGGRMVLGDWQPGDPPLPGELREALRAWAALAVTAGSGGPRERERLRRRGLQLASRVADVLGRPVEFTDPVTGASESVRADATDRIPELVAPELTAPELTVASPEPTPWGTGLTVAAFFAVFVAMADVQLSRAFAALFGLAWIPANLVVGLGAAPSLYLLRHTPFWRWPALGTTAGLVVAWVVLLLGMLG